MLEGEAAGDPLRLRLGPAIHCAAVCASQSPRTSRLPPASKYDAANSSSLSRPDRKGGAHSVPIACFKAQFRRQSFKVAKKSQQLSSRTGTSLRSTTDPGDDSGSLGALVRHLRDAGVFAPVRRTRRMKSPETTERHSHDLCGAHSSAGAMCRDAASNHRRRLPCALSLSPIRNVGGRGRGFLVG
jgi:hypothetical protein